MIFVLQESFYLLCRLKELRVKNYELRVKHNLLLTIYHLLFKNNNHQQSAPFNL